ncbi:MAG: rRNA pseudouridine synthase [Neomegalonema sp.]|nr:rRNA pseudouridine synthase [Neomegalonema sp.]
MTKKETPDTPPKGERIAKLLARAGVASRRDVERMIEAGRVSVDGTVLRSPALNVTGREMILVDGKPVAEPEPPRLWRYHKPAGLVTSARDEQGRQTIYDHLPEHLPRVMPVGRLDLTSEGLLLLTNDGELKRRLELPDTGWLRKYRVRVHGEPTEAKLKPLIDGIVVEGIVYQPMLVAVDRQQGANAWLTVGITEGKNREIRRAMEAVGLPVSRLIRTAYGPIRLGTLEKGAVEEVRARVMRDQLGLDVETPAQREKRRRESAERPAAVPEEAAPTQPRRRKIKVFDPVRQMRADGDLPARSTGTPRGNGGGKDRGNGGGERGTGKRPVASRKGSSTRRRGEHNR